MKKGWEVKVLGDISNITYGYTAKSSMKQGKYHYLRITDIQNNFVNWNSVPFCVCNDEDIHKYELQEGDIVFARTGATTGKSFLLKNSFPKSLFASYLIRLQIIEKNKFSPDFIRYYFETSEYWDVINKGIVGAAQGGFNATKLSQLRISIPPLSEQQRIVEILDNAFTKIDTVRQNSERNRDNAKELFQSILNFEMQPQKNWTNQKLGDVCHLITDGKHGDCRNKENSGYYFLSAKDVKNETLNYENARQIEKEDFEETHRRTNLQPNDVLVTNSGTIGRMAIASNNPKTFRTTFQKSVAVIKPKQDILDSLFCCFHLRANLSKLIGVSAGAAQKNLLLGDLRKYQIQYPPLIEEQQQIVSKLDALSAKCKELENNYQQTINDCDELKKAILAKAFNGEL